MSLTFQTGNKLKNIAKIQGGKYNGKTISLNTKLDEIDETDFKKLRIPNNGVFQLLPDKTASRQIIYITGASGSGKSTFTRKFVKEYKKIWKDRDVYLFSALKEDESLDEIKPKRFRIDESLVSNPLDIEDLKDSLVIMDDIDVINPKKVKDAVFHILNEILQIGRHFNITCIVTNHLPTDFQRTRIILNESHIIVYFPLSAGGKVKYMLEQYVDLDPVQIKYFKKLQTRWVCIYRHFPQLYLSERECGLLNQDTDDEN